MKWLPLFLLYASALWSQPNIIFILTDDQRWDAMGAAGNQIIETPEMDKLAGEGQHFLNAFVTTPICAASRATLLTGQYERTHGFTFGTEPITKRQARATYPYMLKQHGYTTGFVGKFGMRFQKDYDRKLFDYYHRPSEKGRWRGNYYSLVDDHSHKHLTHEIGDLSLAFIDSFANKGPFCLSVSFHAPHADDQNPEQYVHPIELSTLYRDVEIPPADFANQERFEQQPLPVQEGLNYLRWLWRFDHPQKYQKMVKRYYRMITAIDQQLGRIREALEQHNLADNTIIIFMADNGYFLNERFLAGKWLMYEPSLRVPLIIYDPRSSNASKRSDLALNIDIAPTILAYAGLSIPESMAGVPLLPEHEQVREHFLCEHLFNHPQIPRSEGIRTSRFKYFRYLDQPSWEEFYDLTADPSESSNLINDPNYQDEINKLRRLTASEIKRLSSSNR